MFRLTSADVQRRTGKCGVNTNINVANVRHATASTTTAALMNYVSES